MIIDTKATLSDSQSSLVSSIDADILPKLIEPSATSTSVYADSPCGSIGAVTDCDYQIVALCLDEPNIDVTQSSPSQTTDSETRLGFLSDNATTFQVCEVSSISTPSPIHLHHSQTSEDESEPESVPLLSPTSNPTLSESSLAASRSSPSLGQPPIPTSSFSIDVSSSLLSSSTPTLIRHLTKSINRKTPQLEECIISSSNEDHHYCSTDSPSISPSFLPQHNDSPLPESSSALAAVKLNSDKTKSKKLEISSLDRVVKSKHFQTGNDCFKRFFLQKQSDGQFLIVPFGNGNNGNSKANRSLKTSPHQARVHLNEEKLNKSQTMQIENFNPNLLDSGFNSCTLETSGTFQTQAKMSALVNFPNSNKLPSHLSPVLRSLNTNSHSHLNHHQQHLQHNSNSQQQQTQMNAILSAVKHDHPMMAITSTSIFDITSSPPTVSSTSQKQSKNEENDLYSSLNSNNNAPSNCFSQGSSSSISVTSLPPVETIFTDRSISLMSGSISGTQQCSDENDLNLATSFAPTTIIDEHHIDYYDKVDSTVEDDDELLYNSKVVPFGNCFDDEEHQMISSLPSSTTFSPVLDENDLYKCNRKSNENVCVNEDFSVFPNEIAFEFNENIAINPNHGLIRSQMSNSPLNSSVFEFDTQMVMTCDNDPLISGANLEYLSPSVDHQVYDDINSFDFKLAKLVQRHDQAFMGNEKVNSLRLSTHNNDDRNPLLSSSSSLNLNHNIYEEKIEDNHLYKKASPIINKTTQDPTLAQLNLNSSITKEEDDEMINLSNSNYNHFNNSMLPQNSSLLECGNVVDLNGQQQNLISSTSSPTSKTVPDLDSSLFQYSFLSGPNVSTVNSLNSTSTVASVANKTASSVSSTMNEDLVVPDVIDDASLEIESYFQHPPIPQSYQMSSINGAGTSRSMFGSQANLNSPPQISSLPIQNFKSQLSQKQKIRKPNFIIARENDNKTLLSELLSSKNTPISSDSMQTPNSSMDTAISSHMNLVYKPSSLPTNSNQQFNNRLTALNKSPGKSGFNCPTLEALMSSQSIVNTNVNPMLSSAALMPSINENMTTRPDINAVLMTNNNRNRNNSMSTDYSVSSHDEGFASQPDEELEESDDNSDEILMINDERNLVESDMFYIDTNQLVNMSSIVTLNAGSNNCQFSKQGGSQQLATSSSPVCNLLQNGNNDLNIDKYAEQDNCDLKWDASNELRPQKIQSQSAIQNNIEIVQMNNYQSTKASTSSPIDDNEDESEEEEDDDDESFYGDYEASDLLGATTSDDVNNKWSLNMGRSRKGNEKRYFWQYNVQSKGPKGPRLGSTSSFDDENDPHVFNEISDPVFSPDCQIEGVKHSGKARRGDGNDLTPNSKKLLMIGLELKKLSKTINELTPVIDVPYTCRNKSRKEKNKLASRACRLKKKAQHEANKIKLHGLHREHTKLVKMINEIRKIISIGLKLKEDGKPVIVSMDGIPYQFNSVANITSLIDEVFKRNKPNMDIAGKTADFVNHVLDNVSSGIANGGIDGV